MMITSCSIIAKQQLLVIGVLLLAFAGKRLSASAFFIRESSITATQNLSLKDPSRCKEGLPLKYASFPSKNMLPLSAKGTASSDEAEELFEYDAYDDGNSLLNEDQMLDYSISTFLSGEYDRDFAEDAPAPNPLLSPQKVVSSVLQSLRQLDDPEPSHGAAVLMRFCVPLSRGERWGDSLMTSSNHNNNSSKSQAVSSTKLRWKEIMRGAITATMLARRLRSSELSVLLDWQYIDVTEGAYSVQRDDGLEIGVPSSSALAFVNAALYFEDGVEPTLVQFTLRKINNVWLIDSAHISQKKLFADQDS